MEIPDDLIDDLRVSATAVRVWAAIRRQPAEGVYTTQTALAHKAGVGIAAVKSAIAQLEEARWITAERPPPGDLFKAPRFWAHTKPSDQRTET
jgi:hypothetical protein